MTAHELAAKLMAGPDLPVVVYSEDESEWYPAVSFGTAQLFRSRFGLSEGELHATIPTVLFNAVWIR